MELLEDKPNFLGAIPRQPRLIQPGHVRAVHNGLPASRRIEPAENVDERRFPEPEAP